MSTNKTGITRRQFVGGAAAATGILILPRYMLGDTPSPLTPSNRVNIANIGLGVRGKQQIQNMKDCSCDVDKKTGAIYQDYRKMLDERGKDIDGVLIATPDHTHAIIAMEAIRRGKHVYVEKPLAHSIAEIRALGKAAKEHKVVSQLGNQGHSYDSCAGFVDWIRDGAIGTIKEIHCAHPGGVSAVNSLGKLSEKHDIPDTLNWDLWLAGAQYRGYNPMYHPLKWREWSAFGTGAAGDWTCHIVDPIFWALELGSPTSVEASVKDFDPVKHAETFAPGKRVKFDFPAKGDRPAVSLYWYDGTMSPPRPEALDGVRTSYADGGYAVGTNGGITWGVWGAGSFRVFPESRLKDYLASKPGYKEAQGPPKIIKRVGEHHKDFTEAIRAGRPAGSDFADYGGPLTEIALLSIIAMRFPGTKLLWDGPNAKFTNNDDANKFVDPPYREGWKL
jgi:predicted dehydrogenase